jgi:hypothetical protein
LKVVINVCFGGFGLSERACGLLGVEGHYEYVSRRSDPRLVEVVEALGQAADGRHARLSVVEIPDDVSWYIHDYDGMETVHENHRSWDEGGLLPPRR